jgi:uncharacterized protein (TIGR02594 family)
MTGIPLSNYKHIKGLKNPKILAEMLKLYGTKETIGGASNPVIMGWAKELGVKRMGAVYTGDNVPWCGLGMGIAVLRTGLYEPPDICLRALSWAEWGNPVSTPMFGDVLVFKRKGGGHVGNYLAEDAKAYHVIGCNQDDECSIIRIDKKRLHAARRTPWRIGRPWSVQQVFVDAGGASIGGSEA